MLLSFREKNKDISDGTARDRYRISHENIFKKKMKKTPAEEKKKQPFSHLQLAGPGELAVELYTPIQVGVRDVIDVVVHVAKHLH